jgi:glycopeptide antibiotics resistance protein
MRLEFFPFPFLLGIGMLLILLMVLWRRKRDGSYLFCVSIFWIYLLILVGLTIFPIPIGATAIGGARWRGTIPFILSRINFVPFHFGGLFSLPPTVIFREILGNILLTVPFGFGVIFIAPLKVKNIPWLAFAVGLVIESTQLLISIGLGARYRGVDINDVILNALGVLIGYGLFRIFAWIFLKLSHRFRIKPGGLIAYVDDVVHQAVTHDLTPIN